MSTVNGGTGAQVGLSFLAAGSRLCIGLTRPAPGGGALQTHDGDTIVAPATAPGSAGVAVLRLSGRAAVTIAAALSGTPAAGLEHGFMRFVRLRDGSGATLDRGYVVVFRKPRSFTGEDVAELQVHGSPAVVARLMDAAVSLGARPAQPGEFSQRAFRNGRMDLVQAEALADLIAARSESARTLALSHLDGDLSQLLVELRDPMVAALAEVEARLDFDTEQDVAGLDRSGAAAMLAALADRMAALAGTARAGRVRLHGVRVVLVGAPNAGKSTLFNALVGSDRAIVHAEPGTTRDLIEVTGELAGVGITWIDSAGLREGADEVEADGVRRTQLALASADVVVWLADGSVTQPQFAAPEVPNLFAVRTKSDLPDHPWWRRHPRFATALAVSSTRGLGLEQLRAALAELIAGLGDEQTLGATMVLARDRQAAGLQRAAEACRRGVLALAQDMPLELAAADLRDAIDALAEVTGEIAPDDVLAAIFSRFCIGK